MSDESGTQIPAYTDVPIGLDASDSVFQAEAVTLPVVVYSFVGELVSKWNVIFAAVILSMIPFLVFYLFAQKKFIQGFAGGIKS